MAQTDAFGNFVPLPAGGGPTLAALPTFGNKSAVSPSLVNPNGAIDGSIGDTVWIPATGAIWKNIQGGANGWKLEQTAGTISIAAPS